MQNRVGEVYFGFDIEGRGGSIAEALLRHEDAFGVLEIALGDL